MFSRTSILWAMLLTALVAICSWCPVEVLGAQIKRGDKVVTTKPAPVIKGTKTLLIVNAGTELTATDVKQNWVGVRGEHAGQQVAGWIDAAHLAVQTNKPAKPKPGAADYPRELSMELFPAYRIAPPDILRIELPKMIPMAPYKAQVFDVLLIDVLGSLPDDPINGLHLVGIDGTVNLGVRYGTVQVAGMTINEVQQAIDEHLRRMLKEPAVRVQLAECSALQPVSGEHLVCPDGTVNLGQYGTVSVAQMTIAEAKAAIDRQLSEFLQSPDASVAVWAYNSQVYYVITQSEVLGDCVYRFPCTGNETVLDAISQVARLEHLSGKKVWVARPQPSDPGQGTVLLVDWEAITRRAATATNYQIFPGDRVFVTGPSVSAEGRSLEAASKQPMSNSGDE